MKLLVEIAGKERTVDTSSPSGSAAAAEVQPGIYSILRDGRSYELRMAEGVDGSLEVYVNGRQYIARVRDPRRRARRKGGLLLDGPQDIVAPMPGKIVRLLVAAGETVDAGQGLIVVEAMKMQNEIKSPKAGRVVKIAVREGAAVNSGQTMLTVE